MADTAGHAWRILMVGVVAVLPCFLAGALVFYLARLTTPEITAGRALGIVAIGVIGTTMFALLAVVASRFYGWLGDRVSRPSLP